jgi:outer membrane protein
MKQKISIAILVLATCVVNAQQAPKAFTLSECIDYALTNNIQIKNATIDEYIAKAKSKEVSGMGLPQITASASLQHAKPLRRFFGVGTGEPSIFTGNNIIPAGQVYSAPNFFQLQNSGDVSANISQLIFSSTYILGVKASNTYRQIASISKEVTKNEVRANVSKAYYLYMINLKRQNVFDVNMVRLDSLIKQTEKSQKAGFVEKIDLDRLVVSYNNLLTERDKFSNMLVLSGLLLKFQMGMPVETELAIADQIESVNVESIQIDGKSDFENRQEFKLLKAQYKFKSLEHKDNLLSYLPTIKADANLGYFTQSNKFDFFEKSHPWYHYGAYSISANITIFDGLSRQRRIQQSRLKLEKAQNDIDYLKQSINLETKTAELNFKSSVDALKNQKQNIDLAQEVVRVTQLKYRSGVGSNIEVITAESSLKEAQVNYYNALYDAIVYKIEFEHATGNLK